MRGQITGWISVAKLKLSYSFVFKFDDFLWCLEHAMKCCSYQFWHLLGHSVGNEFLMVRIRTSESVLRENNGVVESCQCNCSDA